MSQAIQHCVDSLARDTQCDEEAFLHFVGRIVDGNVRLARRSSRAIGRVG